MPKINQVVEEVLKEFDENYVAPPPFEDTMYSMKSEVFRDFLKSSIKKVLEAVGEEVEKITSELSDILVSTDWDNANLPDTLTKINLKIAKLSKLESLLTTITKEI